MVATAESDPERNSRDVRSGPPWARHVRACDAETPTKSVLDLALKPAAPGEARGVRIGAWEARHGRAEPVDGAPALAPLRPGDAAQARQEVDRLVVLRLDHLLPGRCGPDPICRS